MKKDEYYMDLAIVLAKKGGGNVNPNPQVGALIVKEGRIIGQGYHEKYGEAHAEINAFKSCNESPEGATLYVTLEPCAHQGKQPPCFEAIIKNRIKRVVIGHLDPNPLVSGKGIKAMREAGIEVSINVLEKECEELNKIFFYYVSQRLPYVMMKYAMTLDGKIATSAGQSKWITGEIARQKVHQDRSRFMAIMIGVETLILDDPQLSVRLENGKNPIRIICDTHLRSPLASKIISTATEIPTIIATAESDPEKQAPFLKAGCEIILVSYLEGRLNLKELTKKLGEKGIDSIILEGGGTLNASALKAGIVQKVQTYIAPKIFGGKEAPSPVEGHGIEQPNQAYLLERPQITYLGEDILLESELL
ncbi:bifunctional diaminohydroxyphosphoribosylaminopyrimidine deaminase/5-amino-6-(5-phosphoribosylamino)uracil reductase RibD [Lactococcus lactis]|jgi:diaminohydroxyphosphoribosylaminopyrimidine deaminase/5-amino-6-(5-phosphoribosylamino)uracil reductase|uniref:Riboflavin biosynthesis protein RibD n=1 Tax=Lactococcus lactis TaxID=1358 RepID=A0AAP5P9X1_9LACT|nr:bifunctional diaminohydroxyphosphoribosylaminopyrimidine deaminase/5-amino-6-(5-phosphoribosylamino)uracil reductase RibD [Lactococcus lactis]MDT2860097.1 bifunctional diaminohydroxyphosphoribosylaminopyrimidine deaminase/5-amino-6-(5-phosphoribosylamino)uracil reductase RibD [Lactococcus lactis]MDT2862389.1 bifunctional diaminohydroxyphosphoribosylaminopyrimidine deaminase/5-amino-6-(5-phosphoribosylamino)uracil reductase RibD [Lactococcus lactis]MDT2868011.1 bifunctional diaminohydroxyphosp